MIWLHLLVSNSRMQNSFATWHELRLSMPGLRTAQQQLYGMPPPHGIAHEPGPYSPCSE